MRRQKCDREVSNQSPPLSSSSINHPRSLAVAVSKEEMLHHAHANGQASMILRNIEFIPGQKVLPLHQPHQHQLVKTVNS